MGSPSRHYPFQLSPSPRPTSRASFAHGCPPSLFPPIWRGSRACTAASALRLSTLLSAFRRDPSQSRESSLERPLALSYSSSSSSSSALNPVQSSPYTVAELIPRRVDSEVVQFA